MKRDNLIKSGPGSTTHKASLTRRAEALLRNINAWIWSDDPGMKIGGRFSKRDKR